MLSLFIRVKEFEQQRIHGARHGAQGKAVRARNLRAGETQPGAMYQ